MPRNTLFLLGCLLLASCSTNTHLPQDRADRFRGAELSNFAGAGGEDEELIELARALCNGREYDFTPVGFQITDTAAARTTPGPDTRFAGGSGPLTIVRLDEDDKTGTLGDLSLLVPGTVDGLRDAQLECRFNLLQAQDAINTPGRSFAVNWRITISTESGSRSLNADQVLTGVGFRSS